MHGFSQEQVKARIPHTWTLFFARHGRFTPIQQQAIPPILDGNDTLVIAATASGKTEAVIAPLLERNWRRLLQPGLQQPGLQLLYICPTRALVRDLYERLYPALDDTGITLGMKTGDVALTRQPPAILLTTPESTDALLTRNPKLFILLQGIVLDEIHLFDNTPRGDQLRCLLPRLERIRQYAQPGSAPAQRVALSATVPDPDGVARRYLQQPVVVQVPGGRPVAAEIRPLYNLDELIQALAQRPSYKSLIFCNSRAKVEETAVALRHALPHHADIFVHYSNLETAVRRDVEERFAAAAVAVCVSTSTLELGVDIGSVDDVVLLGAPPDLNAFLQRVGRGGRRGAQTRVLCMPASPGEWARFEAFLALAQAEEAQPAFTSSAPAYGFRPSALIQQIFSLSKQSPTGSIRLADVRRLAPPEVGDDAIRKIVAELTWEGYLQAGRLGEWKPAAKLQELIDKQDIYSNIGGDVLDVTAVDAHSGRVLAYTQQTYPPGTVLLFGGQPQRVVWSEPRQFGMTPAPGQEPDALLHPRTAYAAIPWQVTQTVAHLIGLSSGQMPTLPQEDGLFLFHFWGSVWGELLTAVLNANGFSASFVNEYALYLHHPISHLPPWDQTLVGRAARKAAALLDNRLEMGRFHRLLPADVALTAVFDQLDIPQFAQVYGRATITHQPHLHPQLHSLLDVGSR